MWGDVGNSTVLSSKKSPNELYGYMIQNILLNFSVLNYSIMIQTI
jgi:hypothetical protein